MLKKLIAMFVLVSFVLTACAPVATPPAQPQSPETIKETVVVEKTTVVEVEKVVEKEVEVLVTPTPGPNPEKVFDNVEPNAELTLWTFWLSPTFDDYINDTIARFEATYPGVKVKWEDHQATFLDDYRNAMAAGTAPDVANLSATEGWVREFASKGLLLSMTDNLPQHVIDQYYPGLFNLQLVDGKSYMVPWYQAISIELVNRQIYEEQAGLKLEDFPTKYEDLPALCKVIKEKTGTLCDIRLTMNDLLRDMAYQGDVQVYDPETKKFTFDSPEGVAWLQMYVDWVKDGTLDLTALTTTDDRVGLEIFTQGRAALHQTGPQPIREVRSNTPSLYGWLAAVPMPVGKSGVVGPTAMALSVKADTKYPNAAMALAAFITNPRSQLEFSKIVGIYPSTPESYKDPFFTETPTAIEDQVRPLAEGIISTQADIMPEIPMPKDVNELVRQAVESALFNGVDPQVALTEAVEAANKLIE